MKLDITQVIKAEPVDFNRPPIEFYKAIGEEDGMKELMYDFYDKIYESEIAYFFPQDEEEFEKVKIKNSKFFIQICGGPKVYEDEAKGVDLDEYMIRIHDDFSITEKARVEWLGTMRDAINDIAVKKKNVDEKLIEEFWDYLEKFSKLTVNTFADGSHYYAKLLDKSDSRLGN